MDLKSGNIETEWLLFLQKFEIFLIAIGKNNADSKVKWALLMGGGGTEALNIYNSFKTKLITRVVNDANEEVVTDNSEKYEQVVNEFNLYAAEMKSETSSREVFMARDQKPGESFMNWITDLKILAKLLWGFRERHDKRKNLLGHPRPSPNPNY